MKRSLTVIMIIFFMILCMSTCKCSKNKTSLHNGSSEKINPDRYKIQIFYYPWYSTKNYDGKWRHWVRNDAEADNNDIRTNFFPALDIYSSHDPDIIDLHMKMISDAGIGVVLISWWGEGSFEDEAVLPILDAAEKYNLKVGFYIEPYGGGYYCAIDNPTGPRTPLTAKEDVMHIIDTYGSHNAIYRVDSRMVFLFFAAREYQKGDQTEWNTVWTELHNDPAYNPIVIAHDLKLYNRVIAGGWDGGHQYTCPKDHVELWHSLSENYSSAGKYFYMGVCPGYDDTKIKAPGGYSIDRMDGALYDSLWGYVTRYYNQIEPFGITIATFNEWHEGTIIEPAKPMTAGTYTYKDYEGDFGLTGSEAETAYIDRTRLWTDRLLDKTDGHKPVMISDADETSGGNCDSSGWNGVGSGLLDCLAVNDGYVTSIKSRYREASTDTAVLKLNISLDLSESINSGCDVLEIRFRVSDSSRFSMGFIELGNCQDCDEEVQFTITSNIVRDDYWSIARFNLSSHPNYGNIDWTSVSHLRIYYSGDGSGTNPNAESFSLSIDDVLITW